MNSPLISIVLPTYNGCRYLAEAVQSVIDQTYTNWELIIVDDGSTDNTPEIISYFAQKDSRIYSVRHKKNLNLPNALNTGYALAKGVYLTWISDDNIFLPNALKDMSKYLQDNPQVDIVYTDYTIIDEIGNIIENKYVEESHTLAYQDCVGVCFLYKKCVHDVIKEFRSHLFCTEDYDYWMRASIHFRLKPLHKVLYVYRKHNRSLSSSKMEMVNYNKMIIWEVNLPLMDWVNNESLSIGYFFLANSAYYYQKYRLFLKSYLKSLNYSPKKNLQLLVKRISEKLINKIMNKY